MDIRKRFQLTKRNTAMSNYYYQIQQEHAYREALRRIVEDRAKQKEEDEKRNLLEKLLEQKKKEEEAAQAKKNNDWLHLYVTVPTQELPASRIPSKDAGRKVLANIDKDVFDKWLHTDQVWEPAKRELDRTRSNINFNIYPNPETGKLFESSAERQSTRANILKKGNNLTPEEENYYRTTDPLFIDDAAKLWEAYLRNAENEENLDDFTTAAKLRESVLYAMRGGALPEDYTAGLISGNGSVDETSRAGLALKAALDYSTTKLHLEDPSYMKDAYSKFLQDRTLAEIGTQEGVIVRNKENASRVDRIQQFADLTNEYIDVYDQLGQTPIGLTQKRRQLNARLDQINQQRNALIPVVKLDVTYNLGEDNTSNYVGTAYGAKLPGNVYDSMSIDGLGKALLLYDLSKPDTDRAKIKQMIAALTKNNKKYKQQLNVDNLKAITEGNLKYKELEQYRKWHMPSKDFLEKALAAQENKLSDIDTYLYSMPGTLGSSASYWRTQAVATGLNFLGANLVQSGNPYTAAAGAGLIAAGAATQFVSGANENNAEVSQNWQQGFLNELHEKGLFDKFIKDGRHKLAKKGIHAPTDQDVLDNYTLGNFKSDNDQIENIAEKYIYGANNLFKLDMMATTADVAFNAGLAMFAPGSKYSKFVKLTPIGTEKTAALARLYRMRGLGENAANRAAAAVTSASSKSVAADALRTIASPLEYAYRGIKGGVAASSSRAAGLIQKLDSRISAVADWAKSVPAKLLTKDAAEHGANEALRSARRAATVGTIGRHTLLFAERQAAQAMSEGIEEGKQYENGNKFANKEYAGSNKSMAQVILDDIGTGVNVGFQFLGNQFGIFNADKDLMANMRGGFLGGLLNLQNGVSVAVSDVRGTIRDVQANDLVYHNLLAEKYGGRSMIENGRQFAKYANRRPEMEDAFDRFLNIMDTLADKGEAAFTKEDIDEQRRQFNRISRIVNNKVFRTVAERRGFKPGSDKFNTLASIYNWADQNFQDNVLTLRDVLQLQKDLNYHSEYGIDQSVIDSVLDNLFGISNGLSERNQRLMNEAEEGVRKEYSEKYHREPSDEELERGIHDKLLLYDSWQKLRDLAVMRYYALLLHIQNLDNLKSDPSNKAEFLKHKTKYEYYKRQLDSLRNGAFKKDIKGFDTSIDPFSAVREFVNNDDMFDDMVNNIRQVVQLEAQVNDSASILSDLFGIPISAVNESYRKGLRSGIIDSQYARNIMNNDEISDELDMLTRNLESFSRRVESLSKKDHKAKRKDLVSQYLNGVTKDEEFTEQINRDFREYHENEDEKANFFDRARREGRYMTEDDTSEEESDTAEFDYALHEEAKRRRDDFLDTIKSEKKRDDTLADLASDDSINTAEDVYRNDYTVRDIKDDDFTYDGQVIPVGDNIVKVAERPDGTLIPLTQGQVDYIDYLNSTNEQLEEGVIENSSTPELTYGRLDSINDYEDQILDAILNNDKEAFDRLISLITPFADEEQLKALLELWNDNGIVGLPSVINKSTEEKEEQRSEVFYKLNQAFAKIRTAMAIAINYSNIISEVTSERATSPDEDDVYIFTIQEDPDHGKEFNKVRKELNVDVGGITKAEKIKVFLKAGFKFENRPESKTTRYYAVSPLGDEYRISRIEYRFANFLQTNWNVQKPSEKKSYVAPAASTGYNIYAEGFKDRYQKRNYPTSGPLAWYKQKPKNDPKENRETTQAQRDTLSLIESFQSDNIRNVRKDLTTGMDYFIVIDGKLTRISRVHSYLHPQYGWGQKETLDYENRRKLLYELADRGDIEGLKKLILQWQIEVNEYIEDRYGEDSLEYKLFAINLSPYINCGNDILLDRESLDHIASISHYKMRRDGRMVPACVINRSVIGGTIIDDLCRRFFAGETVEYSDDLMMSRAAFDELIKQLTSLRKLFDNRGWVVSTVPYTWHGRFADGRLVAGETDMIAVDKDGHIHIIDFKTSKRSFDQLLYKNTTEFVGTLWEDVIDGVDYTGKETRHVSHALDDKIGTQKLTAREHYTEQQTHYLNMIRQCLGDKAIVDDASLMVFQVRTKARVMPNETLADVNAFGGFVDAEQSTLVYNDDQIRNTNKTGITLLGVIELTFDENVNKLYDKREDEDLSNILASMDDASQQLNQLAAQLVRLYNENKSKLPDTLKKSIRDLAQSARSIPSDIQDPQVRRDKQSILNKTSQITEAIRKTQELIQDIQKEVQKWDRVHNPKVPQGHNLNPNLKTTTGELSEFDHLNFENPRMAIHPDLKRCSAYPDFLENAVVEVDMTSLGSWFSVPNAVDCSVFVNIYYDEHLPNGQIVHHKWLSKNGRGIKLIPTQKSTNINITKSLLIRKINQLIHDPQNAGKRIILTGASRTNGRVVYSGDSQAKNVRDAFQLSDADLETLQTETSAGHQIGIVKGGGVAELQPASNGQKNITYLYSTNPNRRDALTGELGALTDGVVTIVYNLNYNEDKGSKAHSIPIALTPKQLTDNDVQFIVNLLLNYRRRANVTINGKQYTSPFSNGRLLRTLVRFGQGAEETNSRFIFDWANTDSNGYSTDNYRTVRIALIDQKQPTNPDGSINYKFDYTVDLTDSQAVQNVLIPALKLNVYLYANNEQSMLHASVASRDESNKDPNNAPMTNPFAGLEQFIKSNPELTKDNKDWEMRFSDSLVFRRSDIDPDLDGSNKGITGLHWMIKNGWLRTNFDHVELPLIAFNDAKVDENPNNPKNIDDQPTGPTTAASESPKQDNSPKEPRKRRRRKLDTSMLDDNGAEGMIEPKVQPRDAIKRNVLNEKRARKRIRRILGRSFNVVTTSLERVGMNANEALGIVESDQTAIAYASKDAITLSDAVGNGEEFHEAFHIVMDLLVGEKRRKGIYERYERNYFKKYGKHLSENEISEHLADEYYNFRTQQYFKPSWNIIGSIFNAITDWCSFLRNLGDYKLALVFVEANIGRYRIKSADPESIKAWEARNKNRGNIEPYTVTLNNKSTEFLYFKSGREFDDAVNSVLYQIIKAYGIDNLGQNVDKLLTDVRALKDENSPLYRVYLGLTFAKDEDGEITDQDIIDMRDDGELTVLQATNILKYRELFLHWDYAQRMLNDKLHAMGVDSRRDRLEAEKEDNEGGEGTNAGQDIKDHSDEFYTHARSEDIDAGTRYFLSTIPSVRWATQEDVDDGTVKSLYKTNSKGELIIGKDGKPVRATVPLSINSMGTVQFMPFSTAYQTLLKQLYDVRDVWDLLQRLDNLGENDYLFYYVKKSLRSFLSKSYIRYGSTEGEKQYAGIPKVRYRDGYLSPNDYIVDLNNPTDDELMPTVIRWSHDVTENGVVIAHKGDVIQNAEIITNPKFESITTQLYQSIKSQHLNYGFTYVYPVRDENGNDTGLRYYKEYGTNSQRDSYAYPILWFNLVRSVGDLFVLNEDGKYQINQNSLLKSSLKSFRDLLYILKTGMAVNRRSRISINGQTYNFDNDEDFGKIESLFIEGLNSIGILVSRQVLDHMLISQMSSSLKKLDIFENMLTSQGNDSLAPFISQNGILDRMMAAIDRNDVNFFMQDVNTRTNRTGSYLYSKSGFIISLSKALSDYKQLSQETMVVGPQNTKMYTFAQNHTASDITDDINNTYDENGNIREGSVMNDMKDVDYVVSTDENGNMIGSVIAKEVLSGPQHRDLELHTHSGVRDTSNNDGGSKYSEITAREDTLAKMDLLANGAIIAPTLSDKSTYVYLTGINLSGFNYQNGVNYAQLPKFKKDDMVFYQRANRADNVAGDDVAYYYPNAVLDQMIEYALCEFRNVQKTIKVLHLDPNDSGDASILDSQKVKNYYTGPKKGDAGYHGARFVFLSGIYDENGIYVSFNRYEKDEPDGGVLSSYQLAKGAFFDKSREEQRAIIQRTLSHRLDEMLADLVEKGIIYKVEDNTKFHLKNGQRVNAQHSKYLGYANRYLDNAKIEYLANLYYANAYGKWNMDQCRSMAIVAYVQDVNNKSIMSLEEMERLYTGMPLFFKWKYNIDGDLVDRGEDESKRFGGFGSTGTNNRTDLPNISEEYTCAEIKDWEIASSLSETLSAAFEDDEYREALANKKVQQEIADGNDAPERIDSIYDEVYSDEKSLDDVKSELSEAERDIIDKKIKAESESYKGGINVADGTAYISDRMCENLLRLRGVFTKDVAEAFEYLRNKKSYEVTSKDDSGKKTVSKYRKKNGYMTNAKAYRIIMEAQISTQKYSAFGYRMENGIPVHFYNKFALFPLFEGISYGFTHTLYEKMNDKDNPVDMVMFDSAVKSGSEGAQSFNPDMENPGSFSFAGHTYKLRYRYIRRQLNTDPKAIDDMSMGTLAAKVAFATLRDGQTYTTRDGLKLRGRDLKNQMMQLMNELARMGRDEVKNEFFDESGNINIEKFSAFARRELMNRDANKNLLDALEVVTDENGIRHLKTALDTVSSMSWIESIINSYINKKVIDINLPGNAFYQRSVFGMEGLTNMLESDASEVTKGFDYTINNGNDLLMINEQGSMDCVVSIDFFTEMKDKNGNYVMPANVRNNFLKARQWLIDEGIIGGAEYNEDGTLKKEGAKTLMMSYRIPTQAASSINPLRVVDVLPIVRDTIVLPKEFTKLTGSDFKQILKSLNFFNCWKTQTE